MMAKVVPDLWNLTDCRRKRFSTGEAMNGRWLTIGLVALATAPLIYFGSYLAIVRRGDEGLQYIPLLPDYGSGGRTAAWIFSPAHEIDRKVRPGYWEEWKADFREVGPDVSRK